MDSIYGVFQWSLGTETAPFPPPDKVEYTGELIYRLKEISSQLEGEMNPQASQQIELLLKGEEFDFLRRVSIEFAGVVENESFLAVLEELLNYVRRHHTGLLTIDKSFVDELIEDLQKLVSDEQHAYRVETLKLLKTFENNHPFYIGERFHGQKELADREFCVKLEKAQNLDQVLALATPFQIKSALVYFSIKKRDWHLQEQLLSFMEPLIRCAKSRNVNLKDLSNGTYPILTLVCQRIPKKGCSKGQLRVVELLIDGNSNPLGGVEVKHPWILPTQNLEVHRLFIGHPAFDLSPAGRDAYLEICKELSPEIFNWLTTEKKGEAANFWK